MSTGERRGSYRGNMSERDHFQDTGLDGRVVIKWMFKKWDGGSWTALIWLRKGTGSALLNAAMDLLVS
jgi:hypothetical protein